MPTINNKPTNINKARNKTNGATVDRIREIYAHSFLNLATPCESMAQTVATGEITPLPQLRERFTAAADAIRASLAIVEADLAAPLAPGAAERLKGKGLELLNLHGATGVSDASPWTEQLLEVMDLAEAVEWSRADGWSPESLIAWFDTERAAGAREAA